MSQLQPAPPTTKWNRARVAIASLALVLLFMVSVIVGQRLGGVPLPFFEPRSQPQASAPAVATPASSTPPAAQPIAAAAPAPPAAASSVDNAPSMHDQEVANPRDAGGIPASAIAAGLGSDRHRQIGDNDVVLAAHELDRIGPNLYALVVSGPSADDCVACTGSGGVIYLTPAGDGYSKIGEWLDVLPGEPEGEPPQFTTIVGDQTVLRSHFTQMQQGCSISVDQDIVLEPDGPKALPKTHHDNPPGCD